MEEKAARSTAEIGFVIEADAAAAMMKEWGVATAPELLVALVPSALRMARPPISNFPVGAVGLGESGRIYVGVNMEFPGLPLHHSIHAEQFLVTNAAVHGETGIRCIAVSSAPCGHCRQFLQELRRAADIQILVTSDGPGSAFLPLSSFLPRPFGPPDLLHKDHPLLLEPHDNKIALLDDDEDAKAPAGGGICNGIGGDLEERLRAAAEGAARASHAPYSKCPAGFAVADGEGRVYAGSYEESAAYNPSLGPVQAAAVAYVAAGCGGGGAGKGYGFVAAALVEAEGVPVSHEATARVFLAVVAPRAHLKVYRFHSSAAT